MQEHKKDRRIQRTEQLLRGALIALILKKGYTAITVQDILDQANLGRSTFYAHYRDKEDLLLSGFETLLNAFEKEYALVADRPTSPDISGRELTLFLFQHADENRALFKAMIGKQGGEVIQQAAQKYLSQMTEKYLAYHFQDQPGRYPFGLLVHYVVSSYLAILTWWLDQNAAFTPDEMNTLFWDLVGPGIRSAIGDQPDLPSQARIVDQYK
jgi:AcrR family transcriptional regulator